MKALVLEQARKLSIRDVPAPGLCGADEVRVRMHTVGICGSDVHYYTHGRIGPFVVEQPMVLGHEGSGTVVEVGPSVTALSVGDRVCMEPGVPKPDSLASRKGLYNLDPQVRFWATPPVDGCLIEEVLHPAAYTFSLPESVSFADGAMVEPLAVAVHAVSKARMRPGDIVAVTGAGPIGMLIALVALAGGASQVVISDVALPKLALIGEYNGIVPVHAAERSLSDRVRELTNDWGADVVFEASGNSKAFPELLKSTAPGGVIVLVGMPLEPVAVEVTMLQIREIRIETVFRYANVFDRAIRLLASGKVNVQPLISATYGFDESVQAFQRAASAVPSDVKLQICFG